MSETLININQNQLNTETGSFVELIKNTETAKQDLAEALVNKGANVSSESTFTDLVNATNNLTVNGNFDAIVGNYVDNSYQSGGYYYSYQPSNYSWYTYVRDTAYGVFSFRFSAQNTVRIMDLTPEHYETTDSTMKYKDFTVTNLSSNYSSNDYGPEFFINTEGTKIWYLTGSPASTLQCLDITLDSNINNITVIGGTAITLPSTVDASSKIVSVDETKYKALIEISNSANNHQFQNWKMLDFSDTPTFNNITISGGLMSNTNYNNPCILTKDVFYCGLNNAANIIKIEWDNNEIELVKTLPNITYKFKGNGIYVMKLTINSQDKYIFPYTELYTDNSNQKQKLHLVFLDTFEEKVFDNYGSFTFVKKTKDNARVSTYNNLFSCLPIHFDNKLILSTGGIVNYYEILVDNNEVIAKLTVGSVEVANINSYQSTMINFSTNKVLINQYLNEDSPSLNLVHVDLYKNKIIAYKLGNDSQTMLFMPYYFDSDKLAYQVPEVLMEDN